MLVDAGAFIVMLKTYVAFGATVCPSVCTECVVLIGPDTHRKPKFAGHVHVPEFRIVHVWVNELPPCLVLPSGMDCVTYAARAADADPHVAGPDPGTTIRSERFEYGVG